MPEIALTLVARDLSPALEKRAAEAVYAEGVDGLRLDPLHQGRALDILFKTDSEALVPHLRNKLKDLGAVDIFIQPNDASRKKKLFIADMDATMVKQETLDELAGHLGLKNKVAVITEKAMRGELDFFEAVKLRVAMLKGLPLKAVFETLEKIEYSDGAKTLVATLARHGARCILVSGGFEFFTTPVGQTLGFHKSYGNALGLSDGKLTGEVIPPLIDRDAKERILNEEAKALNIPPALALAIGDGANDVPMLLRAGAGVGYFGKPAVIAATPHQIRHTDLTTVLYMQGYRKQDFC